LTWGPIVSVIASWLASLGITGLVAATTAWAIFKWLGQKWIEDHFSKELESFKAEKQIELEKLRAAYECETERLKADLNRFADRASRFHVREYEVLPEAWGLMNKAFGAVSSAVAAFQRYPDLNRMGESEFLAWLDRSGLEQHDKEVLNRSYDKNEDYIKILNWKKILEADAAAIEFLNYIIINEIFINDALYSKMTEVSTFLRKSIINRRMAEETMGYQYIPGQENLLVQASKEIENASSGLIDIKKEIRHLLSNIKLEV
jgi:hypothetical protein